MNPGITAIVPTWKRPDLLSAVLGNLANQQPRLERIVVVDNGSKDGSGEVARNAGAELVELPANRGFAAAVNEGLARAATEWVAIVNNDVALEAGYFERLRRAAGETGAAFATGLLCASAAPERIDATFDLIARSACAWRAGNGREVSAWRAVGGAIAFAPFTACLLRRSAAAGVGKLDERFESYLEDADYCLRMARAGFKGVYVPEARGTHAGSSTLGAWNPRSVRLISRNQFFLVAKHFPQGWVSRVGWQVLAGQLLWGLLAARHGAFGAWLRGKWEAVIRYKSFREDSINTVGVFELLTASENQLRNLQQTFGFDWYWKTYFRLAG
ncbi:MAG: glycosyltransferase family 2 protein [Bryobacterales bacterium]|nr:glycosyltransferase family 2 protein [Bryobacterales bacterium]